MSIYKACDIRGNASTELTPELYRSWGRALGYQVDPAAKFVVGGDVRRSTPELLTALIEGLCEAGVDVVHLGQLPTPMIYYARQRLNAAGCAIVTASHNPAEINGLKWTIGPQPPTPDDVEALRRETEEPSSRPDRRPGASRPLDVSFDYVAWLQETWVDWLSAHRHIVLDPMHGCFSRRARRYLQAIFPQCLFSVIHDEPDPEFAGRSPDCSRADLLEEVCQEVYRQRADLGLALDGDGDRIAMIDDRGVPLTAEEATWCLLQSFGDELQGEPFVYDLKFSSRVPEAAERLGAQPLVERSGHAFIRRRMLQSDARFGAEISGHYFYRELAGGDDALLTACRLIAYLVQSDQSLGKLRTSCPAVYMTPDLRVSLPPADQPAVIEQVRASWSDHPQSTIDGVRIDFPDGWALVRSSVTEPALTFRFEASDRDWLSELTRRFCNALPAVGERLWSQFEAAIGSPRRSNAPRP